MVVKRSRKSTIGKPRFGVRLLIKHPSIDPAVITVELGLIPHLTRLAGEKRLTLAGTELPGRYRESVWGWSKWIEGKRDFFAEVADLCIKLESHKQFVGGLLANGAGIQLIVDLPGDVNAGSVLPHAAIKRLSDLGIDLGLEVFPKMNM